MRRRRDRVYVFHDTSRLMMQLVVVTPEDWLLGMSDLTGELMRYATNGAFAPRRDFGPSLTNSIEYRGPRDTISSVRVRQSCQDSFRFGSKLDAIQTFEKAGRNNTFAGKD